MQRNVDLEATVVVKYAAVHLNACPGGKTFGAVNLSMTGGSPGFVASTAGTLAVTGGTNAVGTSTGDGLVITNTVIAASGVTFQRIDVNGATNGIVLDTTGTSGGVTITGDGTTTQGGNDSGGILQNTTGDGVVLNNTQNVMLQNMTIGDPTVGTVDPAYGVNNIGGDGVQATAVTGLTLNSVTIARTGGHGLNAVSVGGAASLTNLTVDDSLILNAGDGQEEHGLNLDELRGDNFIRRSVFDGFNETGVEVVNASGTVDLTIDNTTFQDNKATAGNAGEEAILIEAQGTATIVALVTGDVNLGTTQSIFNDLESQSVQGISLGISSNLQLTVENTRHLESGSGDAIIIMNPDNSGSGNLTVTNNEFSDATFGPFAVLAKNDSSGTLDATIENNTVTNMQLLNVNHDDVGSGGAANGTSRVLVNNNNVAVNSNNIAVDVIATETGPTGTSPDLSLTITNNVTSQPDFNFTFAAGLRAESNNNARVNLNVSGNSFQGDPTCCGGAGIEVRELGSSVFGLQGFAGGTAAAAQTFINGQNTGSTAGSFVTSHDNTITSGVATAPTATTRPSP